MAKIDVIYEESLILHSVVLFSKSASSYNKEQDIIEHYWKGISEKDKVKENESC